VADTMEKISKWDILFKVIEKGTVNYKNCLTRLAWSYYDEKQKFCLYKIEFTNQQFKQSDELKYEYGHFKLIKRILSVDNGILLLSKIRNGKLEIDNEFIDISLDSPRLEFISSGSSYGFINVDWPTNYFECLLPHPPFREIVSLKLSPRLNLPLYATELDATVEFLDLHPTAGLRSSSALKF
jgi:hypothetical protein